MTIHNDQDAVVNFQNVDQEDAALKNQGRGITYEYAQECFKKGVCPFSSGPVNWTVDTFTYINEGPLKFIEKRLSVNDKQSYVRLANVQIAHRANCFIVDRNIIKFLMESHRDGEFLSGGYQFHGPLTEMIGPSNPLTEEDVLRHDDLKYFCYEHQFKKSLYRRERFIPILHSIKIFIEEHAPKGKGVVDFSWAGLKFTVSMACKFLLEVSVDIPDHMIDALYDLEKRISSKMLYEPFTYIPDQIIAKKFIEAKKLVQDCADKLTSEDILRNGTGILSMMYKEPKYSESDVIKLKKIKTEEISLEYLSKKSRIATIFQEKILENNLPVDFNPADDVETTKSLIEQMLKEAKNGCKRFDDSQLDSMAKTSLIIGSGAIRSTLVSMMYLLATHPDYKNRLKEHLLSLNLEIPDTNTYEKCSYDERRNLNQKFYDALLNDEMLRNFVLEAYRLYPAVAVIARTAKKDLHMGNHVIKAGTQMYGSSYHINRDETCQVNDCDDENCNELGHRWKDPLQFNPDRFNEKSTPMNAPFNLKHSRCMGEHFANAEIYAFIYLILTQSDFEWGYEQPVNLEAQAGILLKFDKPVLLKF